MENNEQPARATTTITSIKWINTRFIADLPGCAGRLAWGAYLYRSNPQPFPSVHSPIPAAALLFRRTDFSLVRVGISLYGHWPSRETQLSWILEHGRNDLKLEPVLTWKAVVGQIQEVKRGDTVGYGRSWRALRATRLAVVPVGYADGYPRALGNRARALVHGVAVPVVGRVCMNILMLDVTDIPGVSVADQVVLIGRDGNTTVTAEELAVHAETINYELLSRLSQATPRMLVGT